MTRQPKTGEVWTSQRSSRQFEAAYGPSELGYWCWKRVNDQLNTMGDIVVIHPRLMTPPPPKIVDAFVVPYGGQLRTATIGRSGTVGVLSLWDDGKVEYTPTKNEDPR